MRQQKSTVRRAVVLGPQRHVPIVRPAVESLVGSPREPIAFVSAGWEERESEDGEFRDHMQRPVLNLEIWGRVERIFTRDPELLEAMRLRHDTLRRLQELYRLRLEGLVTAAAALLRHDGAPELLLPETDSAIAMLQALDREHQDRIAAVHREFEARFRPGERESVVLHRRELGEQLAGAAVLCIAGGHVGVLLHRLQLFSLLELWGDRPIVAWSAGAMVLSSRVVLFHHAHNTGQGAVDTEVMESGLGILPGIVPLPHSRKRLDLKNRLALRLLARRLQPDACILLDDGDRIDWNGETWTPHRGSRRLDAAGEVREVAR
ncbi:MAG: hypothetical protein ABL997_10590 [Planctomycetota bacterium]